MDYWFSPEIDIFFGIIVGVWSYICMKGMLMIVKGLRRDDNG